MNSRKKIKKKKKPLSPVVTSIRSLTGRGLQSNKCVRCEYEWREDPQGANTMCPKCRCMYVKWLDYHEVFDGVEDYLWMEI